MPNDPIQEAYERGAREKAKDPSIPGSITFLIRPAGTMIEGPNGEIHTVTDKAMVCFGGTRYVTKVTYDLVVDACSQMDAGSSLPAQGGDDGG